jgi:hypothetical protein
VKKFDVIDYTPKIIEQPTLFQAGYMIPEQSTAQKIAKLLIGYAYCFFPGYIWLLRKPD